MSFVDVSTGDDWDIIWNESDCTGSLQVPDHKDGVRVCWDTNRFDVECAVNAADFAQHCDKLRRKGWTSETLVAMNETGFVTKQSSVVEAVPFNLIPRGSLILSPDSIWAGDYWAGMLMAAAQRGCTVVVVAPVEENAPSAAAPTVSLMREVLGSLLRANVVLGDQIRDGGGLLMVGLYGTDLWVRDLPGRLGTFLEKTNNENGLNRIVSLDSLALRTIEDEYEALIASGVSPRYLPGYPERAKPKLHFKMHFFTDADGLQWLRGSECVPEPRRYLAALREVLLEDSEIRAPHDVGLDSLWASPIGGMSYATAGSQNQDRRSMLLDGETMVVIAGDQAWMTGFDILLMLGVVEWPVSLAELDAAYPTAKSSFWTHIGKWWSDLL